MFHVKNNSLYTRNKQGDKYSLEKNKKQNKTKYLNSIDIDSPLYTENSKNHERFSFVPLSQKSPKWSIVPLSISGDIWRIESHENKRAVDWGLWIESKNYISKEIKTPNQFYLFIFLIWSIVNYFTSCIFFIPALTGVQVTASSPSFIWVLLPILKMLWSRFFFRFSVSFPSFLELFQVCQLPLGLPPSSSSTAFLAL